jgi:hypothetical protein
MNQELKNKIVEYLVGNNVIFNFESDTIAINRHSILSNTSKFNTVLNEKESYDFFFGFMSIEVGEHVGYSLYDNNCVYCLTSAKHPVCINCIHNNKKIAKEIFDKIKEKVSVDPDYLTKIVTIENVEKIFKQYL